LPAGKSRYRCVVVDYLGFGLSKRPAGFGYTIARPRGRRAVLAPVFVAEIGDATRFPTGRQLCSWAGLTPRHRESDLTVHRGHLTKQGSTPPPGIGTVPLPQPAVVDQLRNLTSPL
jgi:hypothetical protein